MGSPTWSPTSWFETRRVVRKHLLPLLLPVHRAITLVVNITPSSYRGSGLKSRKLKLKALRNDDNTICLIRVLLILAIRPGNVREHSINDLLRQTTLRANKTIQWKHPEQPVLCDFGNVSSSIQVEKPAGNH